MDIGLTVPIGQPDLSGGLALLEVWQGREQNVRYIRRMFSDVMLGLYQALFQ